MPGKDGPQSKAFADGDSFEPTVKFEDAQAEPTAIGAGLNLPTFIGRYRVERLLGKGGFGVVYLVHDEQLQRPVAVKVPHPELISHPDDAQAYLAEARSVANLDHPHIVPVYDVGGTAEFPVYVVSKFVDGGDLACALKQSRKSCRETAELLATGAEAVHYAHKQGLFYRDLKPRNILLDRAGRPFVVDFGLALRERDVGKGSRYVGTPAYMSPEQARGEGQAVDTCFAERSGRHSRGRRHISGRDLFISCGAPQASTAPDSRPRRSQGPAPRVGHRHQGVHALRRRIAGSVGLRQSSP